MDALAAYDPDMSDSKDAATTLGTVVISQRPLNTEQGGLRVVSSRFGRFAARKLQYPEPTEILLPTIPYGFLNPGGRIAIRQRGTPVKGLALRILPVDS